MYLANTWTCGLWSSAVHKPNCELLSSLSINLLSAKYTDKNLYLLVIIVRAKYGYKPRVHYEIIHHMYIVQHIAQDVHLMYTTWE